MTGILIAKQHYGFGEAPPTSPVSRFDILRTRVGLKTKVGLVSETHFGT